MCMSRAALALTFTGRMGSNTVKIGKEKLQTARDGINVSRLGEKGYLGVEPGQEW
jgi:hypothetical protein